MKTCVVQDCSKPSVGRGLCRMHYTRMARHGDVATTKKPANGSAYDWIKAHVSYEGGECLDWPFSKSTDGRGRPYYGGKRVVASRLMCIEAHGQPPSDDHIAAHLCGNGHLGCVNPKHLVWATYSENMGHAALHGTLQQGASHYAATLSANQVREIRARIALGHVQRRIAEDFNVSPQVISDIKLNRKWRSIDDVRETLAQWNVQTKEAA